MTKAQRAEQLSRIGWNQLIRRVIALEDTLDQTNAAVGRLITSDDPEIPRTLLQLRDDYRGMFG